MRLELFVPGMTLYGIDNRVVHREFYSFGERWKCWQQPLPSPLCDRI